MSIRLSPAVESLVKALGKLPGYGPRSAQRAAFHLLQNRDESLDELAAAVERVRRGVGRCRLCNTFTEGDICPVCLDEERDFSASWRARRTRWPLMRRSPGPATTSSFRGA
jgi:recombination protein RecR